MEIFRDPKFEFLAKKWPFIIGSLVLIIAGMAMLVSNGGPRYGIDFKGGALMHVKFAELPPLDVIRTSVAQQIEGEISVQETVGENEIMVTTELKSETELDVARKLMVETLTKNFGAESGKPDFNNSGQDAITAGLRDPLLRNNVALSDEDLAALAGRMREFRDTEHSGLLTSFNELSEVEGVTPEIISTLEQEFSLAAFTIRSVDIVGPKIGEELRQQAIMATLLAIGGMLVYIAFRFEWIYGVAAVIAVFHDVIITIGLFSIFDKEISLTVIAALLTLVGYSMNDTIVVFDRIRENLKVVRRGSFPELVDLSINQTLSRTILTSGLTFLTVLALFLFGGQVLNGFAFALVVGILVGTYSSIFIASPILVFCQGVLERRKKARVAAAPLKKGPERRSSAKAVK